MLKLAHEIELKPCPECGGTGKVPCFGALCVRTIDAGDGIAASTPGRGFPIPCPLCKGKKVVPTPTESRK